MLLVEYLRKNSANNLEYLRILQQIVPVMGHTSRGRKALVDSGSLKILIEMGLDMSDPSVNI